MTEFLAFRAFSDPSRQAILQLLRRKPSSVGEIAEELPISRPAVSQHLALLREARLVREQRQGTRHVFALDRHGFEQMRAYLDSMWADTLDSFAAHVTGSVESSKKRRKRS
jgi:DNA-binding transcriptional ArsR family regulator